MPVPLTLTAMLVRIAQPGHPLNGIVKPQLLLHVLTTLSIAVLDIHAGITPMKIVPTSTQLPMEAPKTSQVVDPGITLASLDAQVMHTSLGLAVSTTLTTKTGMTMLSAVVMLMVSKLNVLPFPGLVKPSMLGAALLPLIHGMTTLF